MITSNIKIVRCGKNNRVKYMSKLEAEKTNKWGNTCLKDNFWLSNRPKE